MLGRRLTEVSAYSSVRNLEGVLAPSFHLDIIFCPLKLNRIGVALSFIMTETKEACRLRQCIYVLHILPDGPIRATSHERFEKESTAIRANKGAVDLCCLARAHPSSYFAKYAVVQLSPLEGIIYNHQPSIAVCRVVADI